MGVTVIDGEMAVVAEMDVMDVIHVMAEIVIVLPPGATAQAGWTNMGHQPELTTKSSLKTCPAGSLGR